MRINDVLKGKPSHDVVTISPEASVRELVTLLTEHNVGAAHRQRPTGRPSTASSASATSYAACTTATTSSTSSSADIMTVDRAHVRGHEPLTELMQVMTEHRIRHVPVLTDGRLTGIISIGDVVKNRIGELEFERDQLDNYVHQT